VSEQKSSSKAADAKAAGAKPHRARREQIRIRVDKLRQSRQRSMFGLAEVAGFAASLLILILAVFAYLYFLVPAEMRLSALQRERTVLQEQLRGAQEGVTRGTDAQATVEEINLSVERFEAERLPSPGEGRMGLYNSLNQIIRSNALRNTSGPSYVALDPLVANAQGRAAGQAAVPANRMGTAKWQSLFPGIGVSVTVEGQYANLRRFIRDLEASNQFIVINAVELEKATNTDEAAAAAAMATAPPGAQAPPVAATRGTLVSLRVDMAAYYRRNAAAEETAPTSAAAVTR
jgi:Tfp pilus assembly protein PilO